MKKYLDFGSKEFKEVVGRAEKLSLKDLYEFAKAHGVEFSGIKTLDDAKIQLSKEDFINILDEIEAEKVYLFLKEKGV